MVSYKMKGKEMEAEASISLSIIFDLIEAGEKARLDEIKAAKEKAARSRSKTKVTAKEVTSEIWDSVQRAESRAILKVLKKHLGGKTIKIAYKGDLDVEGSITVE